MIVKHDGTLPTTWDDWRDHRLQHLAKVRARLEKERDFRASLYKKYRRGANVVDGLDTGLSVAGAVMAAMGVGLLTTKIATPIAIDLQAGAIASGLLGAGGRFIYRTLEAKARKHDQIRVLAVSKLNSIVDRISAVLTDDKISKEEFCLILSEVDKYDQMKAEIRRGHQKDGGLPETEKKTAYEPHGRRDDANGPWPALGRAQSCWKQWHLLVNISYSRA